MTIEKITISNEKYIRDSFLKLSHKKRILSIGEVIANMGEKDISCFPVSSSFYFKNPKEGEGVFIHFPISYKNEQEKNFLDFLLFEELKNQNYFIGEKTESLLQEIYDFLSENEGHKDKEEHKLIWRIKMEDIKKFEKNINEKNFLEYEQAIKHPAIIPFFGGENNLIKFFITKYERDDKLDWCTFKHEISFRELGSDFLKRNPREKISLLGLDFDSFPSLIGVGYRTKTFYTKNKETEKEDLIGFLYQKFGNLLIKK